MEETQKQVAEKPPKAGGAISDVPAKRSFWKRPAVIIISSVLFAGLFFLGLHYLGEAITHETTDDAFLDGNTVSIAPKVSGQVKKLYVEHNQPVKADDLILEIDPRDYEVQLDQKKSAQFAAQANEQVIKASFELFGTQVQSAQATVKQSEAEAAADQAKADKASADLRRAEDLIQRKIISPQEYDAAKSAATAANASASAGKEKIASDRAKVDAAKAQLEAERRAVERARAQTDQAGVDVREAELKLSYTRVSAPQDGRVTRKAVEAGDYIQAGQRLMALVPHHVWVTANFKETQLKRIRVGQPVRITIDSVAGHTFSGHVQSIQAGSGAAFSLLPPENAVGNFVKVVQRVPVRIFFDSAIEADHVVGPGMSAEPAVRVAGFEFPDFAVGIVAAILALIVGLLWWKLAQRKEAASRS